MFRKIISMITLCALVSVNTVPALAGGDLYGQLNNITAGVYLNIPLGAVKNTDDRIKYGLRLNMRRENSNSNLGQNGFQFNQRQTLSADLMSLNFNEHGFGDLSFIGRKALIYRNGALRAAVNEGKDGDFSFADAALIGAGVILAVGGIAAATSEPERIPLKVCPTGEQLFIFWYTQFCEPIN